MIVVTGGAGFIGSNLLKALNDVGETDILVVDDLTDGHKFVNLAPRQISDYMDKHDFIELIKRGIDFNPAITHIFHLGACSSTTEWDGKMMMENNYEYSKTLLAYAQARAIPFIYASSAAVYGGNTTFSVDPINEAPLNVYGYSKLLFDNHVRRILPHATSQIVGLRYFNVYGPHEQHKGSMASVAYHLYQQARKDGVIKLFGAYGGYGDGEQRRDFVWVEDIATVHLWFKERPQHSGIFNLGTGASEPFNAIAKVILDELPGTKLHYIPIPEHLRGCYQSFTEADMSALRDLGCQHEFANVTEGTMQYISWLRKQDNS